MPVPLKFRTFAMKLRDYKTKMIEPIKKTKILPALSKFLKRNARNLKTAAKISTPYSMPTLLSSKILRSR